MKRDTGGVMVILFLKMDWVSSIQILDETVSISFYANTLKICCKIFTKEMLYKY